MTETMALLDRLTETVTAFHGWNDMRTAMDDGYIPTLFGRTRRERMLTRMLRAIGYRVWSGRN